MEQDPIALTIIHHDVFASTEPWITTQQWLDRTTAKVNAADWIADLCTMGGSSDAIGFSLQVPADDPRAHACPVCGSTTTDKLVHVANSGYHGDDASCACGADYDSEDMGSTASTFLLDRMTPERLERGRGDFAHWWPRAAPPGTAPVRDKEQGNWLIGATTPEGTTHLRGSHRPIEEAPSFPTAPRSSDD